MTIKQNVLKPQIPRTHEVDFGSAIAEAIWAKIGNFHNWTESNIPVGYLLFFYGAQTLADGSPIEQPNPDLWALCDGSVINDPDSPLDGQTLPDLRERFLKGSSTTGLTGGQATLNLQHSHGGFTGSIDDRGVNEVARPGDTYSSGQLHNHSIDSQWSPAEPILPPYKDLQIYVRKR